MRRARSIRFVAFVGLLIALPVFMLPARGVYPLTSRIHSVPALVCLLTYVAIAASIRSRVVGGMLAGIVIWAVANAEVDPQYPEIMQGRLMLWCAIGFTAGLIWDGLHRAIGLHSQETDLGPPPDERTME